jgi:hypothetical protein
LIYFLVKATEDTILEQYLPMLTIWSIATTAFPELAALIKRSPLSLIQTAWFVNQFDDFESFFNLRDYTLTTFIQRTDLPTNYKILYRDDVIRMIDTKTQQKNDIKKEDIHISTPELIEYVSNNTDAFNFIKAVATYYSLSGLLDNTLEDLINDVVQRARLLA